MRVETVNNSKENDNNGIYIIVNVVDCKVYVGQTKKFINRSHLETLGTGKDNVNLQADYDDKSRELEFVYFIAGYSPIVLSKNELEYYENLYMTLMEKIGFTLYNTRKKESQVPDDFYNLAFPKLQNDFLIRFGKTAKELAHSDLETRQQALEYYASQRLTNKFCEDYFFFNRNRIKQILGREEISLSDLDLEEMFFSKAGNYVGEGLDQILSTKVRTIARTVNGKPLEYCLWAFANNAVALDEVNNRCLIREEQGKDIYVLFSYTFSSKYVGKDKMEHMFLRKKDALCLSPRELEFLKFENGEKGCYLVPPQSVCTAASTTSTNAFIIKSISLLKENINEDELKNSYSAVRKYGVLSDATKDCKQRGTIYLKRKENFGNTGITEHTAPDHRTIYFIAKLAAPYIVRLNHTVQ